MVDKAKLPASGKIYLTNVGDIETDQTCGMKYWMYKKEGGKGIIKRDHIVSYLLDTEIHNDLRMLSTLMDITPPNIQAIIDEVLDRLSGEDRQDIPKMELLYRRLGWFAAFAMFIEPKIREEYETLPIDPAIVLDKDPLWVVAYPDRLLKRKATKEIVYREYVPYPPGISQEKFMESWHYNIRLHVGLAAAIDMGLKPTSGEVMAMSRGFRSILDKRLVHPYVWGWHNKSTGEWSSTQPTQLKGSWNLMPVWAFEGGIVSWVRLCGVNTANAQFPVSRPVFLNKDILDGWVAARVHREREIDGVTDTAKINHHFRQIYFARNTTQCYPQDGDMCPYIQACWDKKISLIPSKSELYVQNTPSLLKEISR